MKIMKNDEELINTMRRNEKESDIAFKEIYDRYSPRIYKFIHNSIKNHDDCMDILQQVFLKMYEGVNKFNEKYKFSTWIYKIAVNSLSNFKRGNKRKLKLLDKYKTIKSHIYQPDFSDKIYKDQLVQTLNQEINKLSNKYRHPISLLMVAELNINEISNILKTPVRTIKYRIKKAKEILKYNIESKLKIDVIL